jgi:polyisoprenoid-binding protein YceI
MDKVNRMERSDVQRRGVLKIGLGLIALVALAACGTPAAAPSAIAPAATAAVTEAATAAPSATAAAATEAPATDATATVAPTEAATQESATQTPAEPTAAAATEAVTPTAEATSAATGQAAVFVIDPSKSEASFTLGEKLLGNPNTVVGKTTKVSGTISATLDNPSDSKIGTIQIDASDFRTDSGLRDRSIQRFILESSKPEFQFITFEPTAIEGLPAKVTAGEAIPIKITGNLKIRDVVKPVTFDATVTLKSDNELEGTAKANVTRGDFGLNIPRVASVADVTDEVTLLLNFVATKQ